MAQKQTFDVTLAMKFTHKVVKRVDASDLDQAIQLAKAGDGKTILDEQDAVEVTALSAKQVGGKPILSGD